MAAGKCEACGQDGHIEQILEGPNAGRWLCLSCPETALEPRPNILVVIHNTDGRPCAWGLGYTLEAARTVAEYQWKLHLSEHECYAGERRGNTTMNDMSLIEGTKVIA